MNTYRVAKLEGVRLNYAVALVEGQQIYGAHRGEVIIGISPFRRVCQPSQCWADGGPLIEKHAVALERNFYRESEQWMACMQGGALRYGSTPLVAAMRAIVASKYGETIELPI